MRSSIPSLIVALVLSLLLVGTVVPQSSTGTISGAIVDQNQAVISGATVTARNTATGFLRTASTDGDGRYRLANIPTGAYEVTVEAATFSTHERQEVTVDAGQEAIVNATLKPGNLEESVVVQENASMLNLATAEVSTRFEHRRISELPVAPNRSVYNLLLSAPGISPRTTGQTAFALGISFSANGGRIRSNNFQLDGQDINDPALGGSQMPLNNPDAIQEVRIVTSQFLPEHGHNAGSVVEIFGRTGTNKLHGSAFWFHNNENFNACSNTDKGAGFCDRNAPNGFKNGAPRRRENQFGFTIGGPVVIPLFRDDPSFYKGTNKTFFFADHQRWSDRRTPSITIRGAPTALGRSRLQSIAEGRPHLQQLLDFVPEGIPNGRSRSIGIPGGQVFEVPLGDVTSSADFRFDSYQGSFRIDHNPDQKNLLFARYRYHLETTQQAAQIAPPNHGTDFELSSHAVAVGWTHLFSSSITNEARAGWKRYQIGRDAAEPGSYSIPAIEIVDLGLVGGPESETRTAFGLPTNLPVYRTSDGYRLADVISISRGKHSLKFGVEVRQTHERSRLFSLSRGNLVYATLNDFVNDRALTAFKGLPIQGSDPNQFYRWNEAYFFAQDQWQIRPNLSLSFGVRYEYPGDSFGFLRKASGSILAANGNDQEFRFAPYPKPDKNNWMPRVGLNWNPRTTTKGAIGFVTGGDKLVGRLGYARAYDAWAVNINQTIFTSFPFSATQVFVGPNSYTRLTSTTVVDPSMARTFSRVIVPRNFRSPATDQISFDLQRELSTDLVLRIGYIRTRGTGLFQSVQGNPSVRCAFGAPQCNLIGINLETGIPQAPDPPPRVDPSRGIVTIRANSASSTYDALQTSLEKRLSRGFSFGLNYTWSALLDTASDYFSPSVAEGGVPQDPYDWASDRARGSYDRPHRLSGNVVFELPFFSSQKGIAGKLLGGWQVNSFFSFQSGAPFSPLNGTDPAGVGGSIRPNLFTDLDVSRMSVAELYQIDRQLRTQAEAQARQLFNGLPAGPCAPGWLNVSQPLPYTLFSAPRARIVCDPAGQRVLVMDYFGILPGQRVGNAGRNILRSDSGKNVDIGIIKNTQIGEKVRAQLWIDFFNAFNWRNFGIPSGTISDPAFLDQWTTDGGSRRIRIGARLVF